MGRKLFYRPGSYYVADDRTGFPQRAEQTRLEWTGLRVDERVWEARQPQDLVKGVPDLQWVPDARPLAANVFVGPIYLQTTENLPVGTCIATVQSTAFVSRGDEAAIIRGDGSLFMVAILGIFPAPGVVFWPPLVGFSPSGNEIIDYRIPSTTFSPLPNYLATEDGTPITTESGEIILV